jgi:hypothetical protein
MATQDPTARNAGRSRSRRICGPPGSTVKATTLRFGYRALQMDFEDDRFVLDASLQGYVVGVTFAL